MATEKEQHKSEIENIISLLSDDDLLEEVKHREFKIEVEETEFDGVWYNASKIKIGNMIFDIT